MSPLRPDVCQSAIANKLCLSRALQISAPANSLRFRPTQRQLTTALLTPSLACALHFHILKLLFRLPQIGMITSCPLAGVARWQTPFPTFLPSHVCSLPERLSCTSFDVFVR
jgi:hypothetical protein